MKTNGNTLKALVQHCLITDSTPHSIFKHILKIFRIFVYINQEESLLRQRRCQPRSFPGIRWSSWFFLVGANQPVAVLR